MQLRTVAVDTRQRNLELRAILRDGQVTNVMCHSECENILSSVLRATGCTEGTSLCANLKPKARGT